MDDQSNCNELGHCMHPREHSPNNPFVGVDGNTWFIEICCHCGVMMFRADRPHGDFAPKED